jgi:hypothetical protein
MRPVKFKEQNCTFAENQPEYLQLPALKIDSDNKEVISCWKLSFKERLRVLFLGRIWLSLASFGMPLTPSFMATDKKEVFNLTPKEENGN